MTQRNNINIESIFQLPTPAEVKANYPLTDKTGEQIYKTRSTVERILSRQSTRHMMIVGPCSIHNVDEALKYAERLKQLSEEISDKILLVMRVYFEKPRTIVGWKGLIYDPDLNGSYNIEKGVKVARELLLKTVNMGLPTATEILDPVITQYIADLISWAAIGARTTESQTHRQLVSGLSMPTGFKNTTDGSIQVAIEAIKSSMSQHAFLGIKEDGRTAIFKTKGNKNGHLILRGGSSGKNYSSEYIAFSKEMMRKMGLTPNIIVDCSHGNSNKNHKKQIAVMDNILSQIQAGETSIIGSMLESNLEEGNQKVIADQPLTPGVSITDACLGWKDTEDLIRRFYAGLK